MEPLDGKPWVGGTLEGKTTIYYKVCDDFSVGCHISSVDTDMYAGQKSLKVDLGATRHRMNQFHCSTTGLLPGCR